MFAVAVSLVEAVHFDKSLDSYKKAEDRSH